MRIKHRYIIFEKNVKVLTKIKKILNSYNLTYFYEEAKENPLIVGHKLEFVVYEDQFFFHKIQSKLKPFGMFEDISTEYNKNDIDNTEWFQISCGSYQYPQPEDDFQYRNFTFNLDDYCPICGIGKIQNNPYRLKNEPKQKNNQFWGLHWEYEPIFVRKETKKILEKECIQGIHFLQPILHKNNKPINDFYQLIIETILEKGFDPYNTNTITCKLNNEEGLNKNSKNIYCGRIKYHHPRKNSYLFGSKIFSSKLDFYISNEYFGSGTGAERINIISRKTYEIIKKNQLKGLTFAPIIHKRNI